MDQDYRSAKAQALYEALEPRRTNFIFRAEESAAYTIPSVFPERGHHQSNAFVTPKSGLGAQAVNSLVNKMTSVMIPTNAQFFRHIPDLAAREFLATQPKEVQREVESTLSAIERDVRAEIESQGLRVAAHETFQHLVVAGNALVFFPPKGGMEFFPLHKYVVARDAADNVLAIVIKETVGNAALTEEQREVTSVTFRPAEIIPGDPGIDVYTKIHKDLDGSWRVIQEINDAPVPGTDGKYVEDEMPYHALRWSRVNGEDYGRGICEEYLGSLRITEQLTKAISEGAMAASRILPLVSPNGTTQIRDINEAENGEAVLGNAEDITFMQIGKYADLSIARQTLEDERRLLQSAFLMTSSITRQAERVTAEEIRIMAQELESNLGGVYSAMAIEFQLPLVKNVTRQLQKRKVLPKFQDAVKAHLKPTILTGTDALGRREELDRMVQAFQAAQLVLGPEAIMRAVDARALISDIFAKASVPTDAFMKTEEQIAAEQQAAQQAQAAQTMLEKGTGPAVKGAIENPEAATAMIEGIQG